MPNYIIDPMTKLPLSPARDVAYQFPMVIREALLEFKHDPPQQWVQDFMDKYDITQDEIDAAYKAYALAASMVREEEGPIPALEKTGFTKMRPEVQFIFHGEVGFVVMCTFFLAVRELPQDSEALNIIKRCVVDAFGDDVPHGFEVEKDEPNEEQE